MKADVTTKGVVIPKAYFPGVKEVEILKAKKGVLVIPVTADDPIWQLGRYPVDDEVTDASVNHDRYLSKL